MEVDLGRGERDASKSSSIWMSKQQRRESQYCEIEEQEEDDKDIEISRALSVLVGARRLKSV